MANMLAAAVERIKLLESQAANANAIAQQSATSPPNLHRSSRMDASGLKSNIQNLHIYLYDFY